MEGEEEEEEEGEGDKAKNTDENFHIFGTLLDSTFKVKSI
jgi:hypothetical protein